jgi:uncharacterized protein (DUF2235 family)
MKRLAICFDGTWNRLDAPHPTNVLFTAESVLPVAADGTVQVVYYDEGVGTEEGESLTGGMFGAGLLRNLSEAYRFIIFNYAPGDEIHIFGFSRGAYTARSFAGLLATSGIVSRRHAGRANEAIQLYRRREASKAFVEAMLAFRLECSPELCVSDDEDTWRGQKIEGYSPGATTRLKVAYLGIWDTVGSLGIPGYIAFASAVNRGFQFHDVSLSTMVARARHAVAIDERKQDFSPTLWDNLDILNAQHGATPGSPTAPYQQLWFPGGHGSVGGGGERRGLSDGALLWIWEGATQAGLEFDLGPGSRFSTLRPSHLEQLENHERSAVGLIGTLLENLPKGDRLPGPVALHEVSSMARLRWREAGPNLPEGRPYRPPTLSKVAGELGE